MHYKYDRIKAGVMPLVPRDTTLCDEAELLLSRLRLETWSVNPSDIHRLASLLTAALSLANTVQNSYSPINRIPNEILVLIFACVPKPALGTDWESSFFFAKDLLPITYVCRRWRAVALSSGSLWSSICGMPASQNAMFLERAGLSLLSYHLLLAPHKEEFGMRVLADHHSRIRELQIVPCSDLSCSTVYSALVRLPMPALRHAAIGDSSVIIPIRLSDSSKYSLFNGHAPRLCKLALHSVRGFPENVFEALTHLSYTPEPYTVVKFPDFLSFLSRCPQLQHLVLARLHFNPASYATVPRTSLPRLRTLTFRHGQSLLEVNRLLSSLTLSQNVAIGILVGYMADIETLCAIEPSSLPSGARTKVHLELYDHQLAMVAASADTAVCVDPIPCPGLETPSRVQEALHWVHLQGVRELWLRLDANVYYYPRVLALVESFPAITSLVIRIDGDKHSPYAIEDYWNDLSTPALRLHPGLLSLRLCLWYGSIPPAIKGGLSLRAQAHGRLPFLVLEIPQTRVPSFDMAELEQWADVVEVRKTSGCSWMEVPEVFRARPHCHWPEWPERTKWANIPKMSVAVS